MERKSREWNLIKICDTIFDLQENLYWNETDCTVKTDLHPLMAEFIRSFISLGNGGILTYSDMNEIFGFDSYISKAAYSQKKAKLRELLGRKDVLLTRRNVGYELDWRHVHILNSEYPEDLTAPKTETINLDIGQLGILELTQDGNYKDGKTISLLCGEEEFFLSPPLEILSNSELQQLSGYSFTENTHISWERSFAEIGQKIGFPNLAEKINEHRKKVLRQFVYSENGTYYNNKKFGVSFLNIFQRTADLEELPCITIKLYWTDYYTHRVMKSIFHELDENYNPVVEMIWDSTNYTGNPAFSIFLTSLGINVIVEGFDSRDRFGVILTKRAVTAAETNGKIQDSCSAIEGISLEDYRGTDSISIEGVVYRALESELGIQKNEIENIRFHEFFLTKKHAELNFTCTAQLKKDVKITEELIARPAKDKLLEVKDEFFSTPQALKENLQMNMGSWKPQSAYTALKWLQRNGY